jgi:hypothetical protein
MNVLTLMKLNAVTTLPKRAPTKVLFVCQEPTKPLKLDVLPVNIMEMNVVLRKLVETKMLDVAEVVLD